MIKKIFILWALGLLSACGGSTPTTNTAPAVPTITATANGAHTITVSWSAVAGAVEYEIYRSINATTPSIRFATTTGTSYTNTGLSANTTYYYWAKACNSVCSDYSNKNSATTAAIAAPIITATADGTSTIIVSWPTVTTAVEYEIYRSINAAIPSTIFATTTGTSYINTGLSTNTTYYYWAKACNSVCSYYSNRDSATTAAVAAPSAVTATITGTNTIIVSWNAVTGINYYEIYRNTNTDSTASTRVATTTDIRYTNTGLNAGTTYYYWAKACNSICSYYSNRVSATTAAPIIAPITPTPTIPSTVTATANGAQTITVSWSAVTGAVEYEIYRSTDTITPSTRFATTTGTSYTNTGLSANTTYYYWTKACNVVCSDFSNSDNATTAPTAPSAVAATADGINTIRVSWSAVTGAVEYEIYRSTNTDGTARIRVTTATGTSYTNTGLNAGTTYYYWAKACNGVCSDYSNSNSATTVQIAVPIITTATGINTITVSWSEIADVSFYEIYRSTGTIAASSTRIARPSVSDGRSYINVGLSAGTTYYYYWVKACLVADNCSNYSNIARVKVLTVTGKLNDTGIVFAGNELPNGNNSGCTSDITHPQDCNQGRDAKAILGTLSKIGAGAAGFDFTKLGSTGNVLATQNQAWTASGAGTESTGTKWSCVKDNVTGLVWEVKTDNGSADTYIPTFSGRLYTNANIHHKDNTYLWGGLTAIGATHTSTTRGTYYSAWTGLVNGTNSESLCGFSNWRVPTINQLRSIAYIGRVNPSIDTNYFPNTDSNTFWSSNPYAPSTDNTEAWILNFNSSNYYESTRNSDYRVRLVSLGE